MSIVNTAQGDRRSNPVKILTTFFMGMAIFFLGIGMISGGFQLVFKNRILPGVWVAEIDLSSMTPGQAVSALENKLSFINNGQITLEYGENKWVVSPGDMGMSFDADATVDSALKVGRKANIFNNLADQINAWQGGVTLYPIIKIDERSAQNYLQGLASQIDQPKVEAELRLDGMNVIYSPGQPGRMLNLDATLEKIVSQLELFQDGSISLVVEESAPQIQDASVQADYLREALSAPFVITLQDAGMDEPGPWTIPQELLVGLMTVNRVESTQGWEFQITLNSQAIDQFLDQINQQIKRDPINARFWFDDNTRQLVLYESAQIGRDVNIQATCDAIISSLSQGQHAASLVLETTQPEVNNDATAESLGITSLVSSYTSYFRGSTPARLTNIDTARKQFYGYLIPPNSTFSMGSVLGDISLDNGYAESLIIYNGRSITGVGGGVCQVSTTLFLAAYYGGYPIVERHEHAYRVFYYEQTATGINSNLAGLDATVYFPLVDLKFTNDRPYWLLMETYFDINKKTLQWKFYSGDDGRTVDVQNLGLRNVVTAPEPKFEENPDLPPDTCKQVDWAADGADITVVRTVSRGGQQLSLLGDTIKTHYEPWQAVYQYGPGTSDPQGLLAAGLCH